MRVMTRTHSLPALPTLAALLAPPALQAQVPTEPWLAEVPTARQIVSALQPSASRLHALKTTVAMFAFQNLAYSLGKGTLSREAQARVNEYLPARDSVA